MKKQICHIGILLQIIFELRNPSAHSYGNINYKLEKAKTVQAQCFAAIIVRDYFNKHVLELKDTRKTEF